MSTNYHGNFAKYYDKIFSKKDYRQETQFILDAASIHLKQKVNNVLDFGCGTGTHSYILSQKTDFEIVGYDKSASMVSLARDKYKNSKNCNFINNIDNLKDKFDLIISMFFVVNHINKLKELEKYINDISLRSPKDGIFIFDCFNAVAALRDPPVFCQKERYEDEGMRIVTSCTPSNNLMDSFFEMKNKVEIYKNNLPLEEFEYNLQHTLWSPRLLRELLNSKGFRVLNVYKPYDIKSTASREDYKIVYVCKKEEG